MGRHHDCWCRRGVALGWAVWALSVSTVPPFRNLLLGRTGDVLAWAVLGAVVAGGLAYARRVRPK